MSLDFYHPLFEQLQFANTLNSPIGYLTHISRPLSTILEGKNLQIQQRLPLSASAISNQRRFEYANLFQNHDIGRSGDRSSSQKACVVSVMDKFIQDFLSPSSAIVFCDGSASGTKCGSACVILTHQGESVVASRYVNSYGDNVEAEVDGILLAFEQILFLSTRYPSVVSVAIVSDCDSAAQIVANQSDYARWSKFFLKIWEIDNRLLELGVTVGLTWCPSHCGVPANEQADAAAKAACSLPASEGPVHPTIISLSQCVSIIAEIQKDRWQKRWNTSPSGSSTRDIIPSVGSRILFSNYRSIGMSMVRCLLNNAAVNDVLFKINLVDSPNCPECNSRQTVEHVILECPHYALQRRLLKLKLPSSFRFCLSELLNPSISSKRLRKEAYEHIHAFFKYIIV